MEIMLSLEGTLADFVSPASKIFDYDISTINKYDLQKLWDKTENTDGFWENVNPYPWASDLIWKCYCYTDQVGILISPCSDPRCMIEKFEWAKRHFPKQLVNLTIVMNRFIMYSPYRIMVHDDETFIRGWRRKGGKCILFPQPWNSLSAIKDRVEYVENELKKMCY